MIRLGRKEIPCRFGRGISRRGPEIGGLALHNSGGIANRPLRTSRALSRETFVPNEIGPPVRKGSPDRFACRER